MAEKQTFPRFSEVAWWTLRDQFAKTVPSDVSLTYIRSLLGLANDASARNYISPLRQMGIIDENSKPTPRANKWRVDSQYQETCNEIIEAVYPQELKDLHRGKNIDRDKLVEWFKISGQLGVDAANKVASFYILLNEGEPKSSSEFITKATGKSNDKKPIKSKVGENGKVVSSSSTNAITSPTTSTNINNPTNTKLGTKNIWGKGMSLHIDLQIHISHQATPEQIDSIFASMAKHLPSIANQEASDEE